MTTERQPTCEERIEEHLLGRLTDFRLMLKREDPEEPTDEEYEESGVGPLGEYPLGASVRYAVRIELSTGGPADYLEYIVEAGEVQRATYHFADWFDHAERTLTGDEFETAEDFLNALYSNDLEYFLAEAVKS